MSLRQMPFFPADFFADTEDMTPDGAKAYLFLLGHAWIRSAKLPNNDSALARMARLSPRAWAAIKSEVMDHWTLGEDNHWRQQRLQKEWDFVCTSIERKRKSGSLGGQATSRKKTNRINETTAASATVFPLHARASSALHVEESLSPSCSDRASTESPNGDSKSDDSDLDAMLYRRGKSVLGDKAGGMITKLKKSAGLGGALEILDAARRKESPIEYVAGAIRSARRSVTYDPISCMPIPEA